MRAAVVTISSSRTQQRDESGDELERFALRLGMEIVGRELVPDEREKIAATLRKWSKQCEVVLTTGGTGFSPSDVTPEATRDVIEKEAPGISEAMRMASREHTDFWMLSRAVSGIRGRALIINFPGSPKSITEAGGAIAAAVPHALELLWDRPSH